MPEYLVVESPVVLHDGVNYVALLLVVIGLAFVITWLLNLYAPKEAMKE